MAKSLDMLLSESGDFIESRINAGLSKTAAAAASQEDDIFKLAQQLRAGGGTVEADVEGSALVSLPEKIANARAIVETFVNLPLLQKLDALEKQAMSNGHSEDELRSFIEKRAQDLKFRSILDLMPGG